DAPVETVGCDQAHERRVHSLVLDRWGADDDQTRVRSAVLDQAPRVQQDVEALLVTELCDADDRAGARRRTVLVDEPETPGIDAGGDAQPGAGEQEVVFRQVSYAACTRTEDGGVDVAQDPPGEAREPPAEPGHTLHVAGNATDRNGQWSMSHSTHGRDRKRQ